MCAVVALGFFSPPPLLSTMSLRSFAVKVLHSCLFFAYSTPPFISLPPPIICHPTPIYQCPSLCPEGSALSYTSRLTSRSCRMKSTPFNVLMASVILNKLTRASGGLPKQLSSSCYFCREPVRKGWCLLTCHCVSITFESQPGNF